MSEMNDVWSIGVILYLLISGGVKEAKHEEKFDFREHQWLSVSEELNEFIHACVAVDPKKRLTIA